MFEKDVANNLEKLLSLQEKLDNLSKKEEELMELWQKYENELEEENGKL